MLMVVVGMGVMVGDGVLLLLGMGGMLVGGW